MKVFHLYRLILFVSSEDHSRTDQEPPSKRLKIHTTDFGAKDMHASKMSEDIYTVMTNICTLVGQISAMELLTLQSINPQELQDLLLQW